MQGPLGGPYGQDPGRTPLGVVPYGQDPGRTPLGVVPYGQDPGRTPLGVVPYGQVRGFSGTPGLPVAFTVEERREAP
ncbi:hypothetical protein GCM10023097_72990 [Streptomyces collinus]